MQAGTKAGLGSATSVIEGVVSATYQGSVLILTQLADGTGRPNTSWFVAGVFEQKCNDAVSRDFVECDVSHGGPVIGVGPEVANRILTTRANPWGLSERERHVLRLVVWVQEHENSAVLALPAPVLRRCCVAIRPVRNFSPSERRDRGSNNRVLIDRNQFMVRQDFNCLLRDA